ncbi:hypothetical protein CKO15_09180 [Halorhodospira abdelmalekii]|nr:hypothetical protein [Halorhodospira abdelmalekii]
MRESFTITVSDFRGTRQFALHRLVKRLAIAVVIVVATALLGTGIAISALQAQIANLDAQRAAKTEIAQELEQRNAELRHRISEREQEIRRIDYELGHIESLVGFGAGTRGLNSEQRASATPPETTAAAAPASGARAQIDPASLSELERELMLRSLPDGWPLQERSRITSGYGWREHPITGQRLFHAAVDLRAPHGEEIIAPADGVVHFARNHGSGLGKLIILDHDYGFQTHYAHLSRFNVSEGEFVRAGDVIGYSGTTGNVTGAHLHYEIWHLQRRLNPEPFLEWSAENYTALFEEEQRVNWSALAEGVSQRAYFIEQQEALLSQQQELQRVTAPFPLPLALHGEAPSVAAPVPEQSAAAHLEAIP